MLLCKMKDRVGGMGFWFFSAILRYICCVHPSKRHTSVWASADLCLVKICISHQNDNTDHIISSLSYTNTKFRSDVSQAIPNCANLKTIFWTQRFEPLNLQNGRK